MKFRRKEQIIEAVQWFPGVKIDCVTENVPIDPLEEYPNEPYGKVRVDEISEEYVLPGEWVVIDPDGFGFPYSDGFMKNTFDLVYEDSYDMYTMPDEENIGVYPPNAAFNQEAPPFQYIGDTIYPPGGNPPQFSYVGIGVGSNYTNIDPEIKKQLDRIEKKLNILLKCKGLEVKD